MTPIPTDLKILTKIYNKYYITFTSFGKDFPERTNKYYVQIDIPQIAKELNADPDIIFGRLLNLDNKFGYKYNDCSRVCLFNMLQTADLYPSSINFPLVATILAELRDKDKKYSWTIAIAVISLIISIISIIAKFIK